MELILGLLTRAGLHLTKKSTSLKTKHVPAPNNKNNSLRTTAIAITKHFRVVSELRKAPIHDDYLGRRTTLFAVARAYGLGTLLNQHGVRASTWSTCGSDD